MSRKIILQPDEQAKEFTYGIEIETTVPKAKRMSIGTYAGPKQIRGCPAGWVGKTDSSILPAYNYKGVEITSPVLQGLDGMQQIAKVTDKLQTMGAVSNNSCGFHVHVGLPKKCYGNGYRDEVETKKFLINLVSWTGKHELGLYASTGNITRVGNIYCNSVQERYKLETIREEPPSYLEDTFHTHEERYNVLNIINLFNSYRPDTVEFRVFPGTINLVDIQGYIQVALGLVRKALGSGCKNYDKKPSTWGEKYKYTPGELAIDQLLYSLWWHNNDSNHPVCYGWVIETEKRREIISRLFQLAKTFDEQVTNNYLFDRQQEVLKKWYKLGVE